MSTATATRRTYLIDKSHSEATFQVRHLLTKVRGRFSDFAGTIALDADHPDRSSVTVTIQAASIDTSEPNRDTHLRSADFFSVDEFATLSFNSVKVAATSAERFDVTGDLTIRGVTKRIVVPVSVLGKATDPWGNERVAFEAEAIRDVLLPSTGSVQRACWKHVSNATSGYGMPSCFLTIHQVLQVKIKERQPIARVITVGGNSFYIDSSCQRLPLSDKLSARVPVFTGFPSEKQSFKANDRLLIRQIKKLSISIINDPFLDGPGIAGGYNSEENF